MKREIMEYDSQFVLNLFLIVILNTWSKCMQVIFQLAFEFND